VNAVYGFTMLLLKVLKDMKPSHMAVTFDRRAPTFRHQMYKEYKATRVKQPQELYDQLTRIKEVVANFNIPIFELDGYEADDIIATICDKKSIDNPETLSIILTGDMDTLQLVDDNTNVLALKKGITDTILYDEKAVETRYGLAPKQMIDFKALRGDPSDNIPGIRGIGEKTAAEIIKNFGSLENLYTEVEKESKKAAKIKERYLKLIKEQKDQAFMSKKLVELDHHVPINFDLNECRIKNFDREKMARLFQELGFKSLLNRLPENKSQGNLFGQALPLTKGESEGVDTSNNEGPALRSPAGQGEGEGAGGAGISIPEKIKSYGLKYKHIDTEEKFEKFYAELKKQSGFAVDTETTGLDPFRVKLLGISFSWQEKYGYYLDLTPKANSKWLDKLKIILEDKKIEKYGHNMKYDMAVLASAGVNLQPASFDTILASYLLNPGSRAHKLDDITFAEFGYEKIHIENLIGKGKKQISMADVPVENLALYSSEDADFAYRLVNFFEPKLRQENLLDLFHQIEMPLIPVLVEMEKNGIKIDVKFLAKLKKELNAKREKAENKIYELAGVTFNVNSPKQLKEVLFQKLQLPTAGIGKTKTGISTAAGELEKLQGKHPIIDFIFEQRELAKLISTYVEALPELVNPKTDRVHTSYNQTVTATGRLSSSDPNLQNIPAKTELGQQIRKAFIAEKGYKLIAADYSQIELRVVASLANDQKMMDAFISGEDIHTKTASEVWGVPADKVTPEMRRSAKTINFGVTYGMGARGLSQSAGISYDEAAQFIEKYFDLYNGVSTFLEETVRKAREQGYVETLFGRKRYLPEIVSGVPQVRNAAERMAINMPVQGTAADILKIAMIRLNTRIAREYNTNPAMKAGTSKNSNTTPAVRMLLQVHDELVFEVREDLIGEASKMIREEMEGVDKLKLPIKVEIEVGDNWGEMEEI